MANRKPGFNQQLFRLSTLIVLMFLLPILLLLPAGVIWLWERGWIYGWLLLAAALTGMGYAIARWVQHRFGPVNHSRDRDNDAADDTERPLTPPDAAWSPQDLEAWREVQTLARQTDKSILASQTLLLQRGRTVIEQVAVHYYPDHKDPVWNFTLPEALLLSERVSQRLRVVLSDQVPAVHKVQVGQILRLWQMKNTGQKYYQGAYLAYRLVRWVNPVGAILAEARERVLEVAFGNTSDYLRQKGARIWVEEVGRAAIELYSGRLRADPQRLAELAAKEVAPDSPPGPVQVLVAGQVNVGKSSLINALFQDTQVAADVLPTTAVKGRYPLVRDGETRAVLMESPGLTAEQSVDWWRDQCAAADCLIWVVAAHRADRALDRQALEAIREGFRGASKRSLPPLLVIASHVDRLSPAREWSPPYNIETRDRPKAAAMGEALDQIAQDLNLDDADLVPARLDQGADGYNIDLLWALLEERLEQGKHGRAQRLNLLAQKTDWKKIMRQARGAGRLIKRTWKR